MTAAAERGTWPEAWPALVQAEVTGRRELLAAGLVRAVGGRPAQVTALIAGLAAEIGGRPVTPDLVRHLSAGTREWLLQQLGAGCRPADDWFEVACPAC